MIAASWCPVHTGSHQLDCTYAYGDEIVPYKSILVPIQGNAIDQHAIELATTVTQDKSAQITLVYVVEVEPALPLEAELPSEIDIGERSLEVAEQWTRAASNRELVQITPELLQARSAGAAIVDEAIERGADLIVMALRNQKRHGRPTVGDTVPFILKNAPCEVIVTRLPALHGFDKCEWKPEIPETV